MTDSIYATTAERPIADHTVSDKHIRFVNIAEKRANKVLNALDVFRKCFDTRTYEYTSEEVENVLGVLESKIVEIRSSAERGSSYSHFSFN